MPYLVITSVQSHTSPWPKPPWAYQIPGHSPQSLMFEEISPEDTGIEGQQSALHACDEVVRWLWENYKEHQVVEQSYVQKVNFNGKKEGHVAMFFLPITVTDTIDRELALDSLRSMEILIWRYGGHSVECEIWSGGKAKGRIWISVTVLKAKTLADTDNVAVEKML